MGDRAPKKKMERSKRSYKNKKEKITKIKGKDGKQKYKGKKIEERKEEDCDERPQRRPSMSHPGPGRSSIRRGHPGEERRKD